MTTCLDILAECHCPKEMAFLPRMTAAPPDPRLKRNSGTPDRRPKETKSPPPLPANLSWAAYRIRPEKKEGKSLLS